MFQEAIKQNLTLFSHLPSDLTNSVPRENSFILYSKVNPKILSQWDNLCVDLEKVFPSFTATTLEAHLTIGFSKPMKDDLLSASESDALKVELTDEISELLNQVNKSIFLAPSDISISPTGWVLLEYAEIDVISDLEANTLSLQELHTRYVDILEKEKYQQKFIPEFVREGYKPHLSLGKIKTSHANQIPCAEELTVAAQQMENLQGDNKALLQAIAKRFPPLNLYDFHLKNNLLPEVSLLNKKLPRRNLGVKSVMVDKQPGPEDVLITFSEKNALIAFQVFLKTWGVHSRLRNAHEDCCVLVLSREKYGCIAGIIDKCFPIEVIETPNDPFFLQELQTAGAVIFEDAQAIQVSFNLGAS